MAGKAARVTLVREKGYEEKVKPKVVRELDLSRESQVECWDDPEDWEECRKLQIQADEAQATERGTVAQQKLEADKWMQNKIDKAEEGLRKSVQLVEKLRAANLVRQHRDKVQIIDVGTEPAAKGSTLKKTQQTSSLRPAKSILRDSQNLPKLPVCPDLQHQQQPSSKQQQQQPVKQQPRKRIVWKQPQPKETKQRKPASNENSAKTQPAKSNVRSKVDNTRKADSSKLSTILEATENAGDSTTASSIIADDEIDFIPVRGPSAEEDRSSSSENLQSLRTQTKSSASSKIKSKSRGGVEHPSSERPLTSDRLTSSFDPVTSGRSTSDQLLRPSLFVPPPSSRTSQQPPDSGHHSSGAPTPTLTSYDHLLFPSDGRSSDSFDLESIAIIIDRIKAHRRLIEEEGKENERPETFFKVVNGSGQGSESKFINNTGNNNNNSGKNSNSSGSNNEQSTRSKFQLDRDFIKKVLEFESSSPLHFSSKSDGTNSSADQPIKERKRTKRKTKTHATETRPNLSESSLSDAAKPVKPRKIPEPAAPKEMREKDLLPDLSRIPDIPKQMNDGENRLLRGYIEKLLSMKHEEIENLSVSTVHSATTENFPLHSSLKSPNSLSSSSDPGKKVRFELTEGVDSVDKHLSGSTLESENSLDQTKYKQLQLKLNSQRTRNEQLDSDFQHESPQTTAAAAISSIAKTTAAVTTMATAANTNSSSTTTTVRTQIQTTSRSVEDLDTTMLSYQEIQQIFREKRRELDVQLAHLEDGGYQHMEMSEGSLSTSRSEGSLRTSKGSLSTSKASVSSGYVASKGPDLQNKYLSSGSNSSSNSLTNVTSVQSSSTSTDSRNHSVGSRFTLSDVDSDFPKLLKQVTQSTPHKNVAMAFEREQRLKIRQFSGPTDDDDISDISEIQEMRELTKMRELKGRRTRELAKMREFKEMRELSSFFSDAGTDSESGSKLSRIDLSSDTSNIH